MAKKSDPEQSKRFIETARTLECDEDEAAFDEKLKRILRRKYHRGGTRNRQKNPERFADALARSIRSGGVRKV